MRRALSLIATLLVIPAYAAAQKFGVSGGCDCADSQVASGGVGGSYCSASSVTYTGAAGTTATITFGDPDGGGPEDANYSCGQYANGDVWVAGKDDGAGNLVVRVESTSPAANTSAGQGYETASSQGNDFSNGWDVDISAIGRANQNLDGRVTSSFVRPTTAHPLPGNFGVESGYRSFHKAVRVGDGRCGVGNNASCTPNACLDWEVCWNGTRGNVLQFAPVVTFVECSDTTDLPGCTYPADTDGDGRTDDEFRPAWFGTAANKLAKFRWDQMERLNLLGQRDNTQLTTSQKNGWTCSDIQGYFRYPRYDIVNDGQFELWQMFATENFDEANEPAGCQSCTRAEYGLEQKSINAGAMMRFSLDDYDYTTATPGHACYQALAGFMQVAIDTVAIAKLGGKKWSPWSDTGGHLGGRKIYFAMAKMQFDDHAVLGTPIQEMLDAKVTYEDWETHTGENGVAYWGSDHSACKDQFTLSGSGNSGRWTCAVYESAGNPAETDSICAASLPQFSGSSSYPNSQAWIAGYSALAIRTLGLQNAWANDAHLTFAVSIREGGRDTGHTKGFWCSPDGLNNSPPADSRHLQTPEEEGGSATQRQHDFGEAFWDAFWDAPATPIDFTGGATCGDGMIEGSETCDDSDTDPGDGCDGSCQVESGWSCTGEPSVCDECGNGTVGGTEQCDDGINNGDTKPCTSTCKTAFCDDGLVCSDASCTSGPSDGPEGCDDGAAGNADTKPCLASCAVAICGDNLRCSDASCTTGPASGPEDCDGTDDAQCPGNCDGSCACTGGDTCGDDACGPTENSGNCFADCATIDHWIAVDPSDGDPILEPWDGSTVFFGLSLVAVQADVSDGNIASVQFELNDDPGDANSRCENLPPYDMGPAPGAALDPWPGAGTHKFEATPHSASSCGGTAGQTSVLNGAFAQSGVTGRSTGGASGGGLTSEVDRCDIDESGSIGIGDILGVSQVIFGLAEQDRCYARPLPLELPYPDPLTLIGQ